MLNFPLKLLITLLVEVFTYHHPTSLLFTHKILPTESTNYFWISLTTLLNKSLSLGEYARVPETVRVRFSSTTFVL